MTDIQRIDNARTQAAVLAQQDTDLGRLALLVLDIDRRISELEEPTDDVAYKLYQAIESVRRRWGK